MKALVVPSTGAIEIADLPEPKIGPYEALVRIDVCGICNSTDAKLIDGTMFWGPPPPFVLGHESIGVVVETGEKVTSFRPGDRVTRPVYADPSGRYRSANGGFAEFGVVRDARAMAADGDNSLLGDYNAQRQLVVPKGLDPVAAALAISLSEVASLLDDLPNLAGKTVLVAGTGTAGLAFGMWAKLAGAKTIVLGRRAERLEIARRLGADAAVDTSQTGWQARVLAVSGKVDGVLEASGVASLALELPGLVKDGGFAVAYGVPPKGDKYDASLWRNADVNEHHRYAWVADLLLRGWVRPDWFVTREWPMADAAKAFSEVRAGGVLKGFLRL
ncbi:MAG: zinc-binding dehydrogenase [Capsulimonadaceae bacterium]|nr:zinc-binding dehydrogenase [Capsulimonadaceae bacterium]